MPSLMSWESHVDCGLIDLVLQRGGNKAALKIKWHKIKTVHSSDS